MVGSIWELVSMDGFGSVNWWGFSPAVDLEQHWRGVATGEEDGSTTPRELNILLVGAGDLRHVLTTLASATMPVHFFIVESCLELYSRHLLFLKLLSDPSAQLGLQEKVELFLELFGNSLLRSQTLDYLTEAAGQLIKLITDPDYQLSVLPLVDLSALKFKERDFLEGIFKFWRDSSHFPIQDLWDMRLRSHLGRRYDSRDGVFDWDYHMKLHDMAPLVDSREYKRWRANGVAFQLRADAPYQLPNRTLASGKLIRMGNGDTVARRGYWGDIVSSPYLSFGIEVKDKELLRTEGGEPAKTSVLVSEHSVSELMHLLGEASLKKTHGDKGETSEATRVGRSRMEDNGSYSITFLPLQSMKDISQKPRFRKLFNIAYFSNSMVHHLRGGVEAAMAAHSVLVCESVEFMLDLKRETKEEFVTKVSKMATSLNFKACDQDTGCKHHLTFTS